MKFLQNIFIAIMVAAALMMTGCAGKPIKVGLSEQQIANADIDYSKGHKISASAGGFQLLLLIPISINDRHERAYNALLEKAGNDYISDVKVKESWTYAFIGTIYRTTLEATAYPRKTNTD